MTPDSTPETFARRLPSVNDRILTTCFLAALFHGIIILGITFSGSRTDASNKYAPSLEVTLVSEQPSNLHENPSAEYLAQRNQHGFGNTSSQDPAAVPRSSPAPFDRPGANSGSSESFRASGASDTAEEIATSATAFGAARYFARLKQKDVSARVPELLENRPDFGLAANSADIELRLRGRSHHDQWVSADTRESKLAVYLDAWRRKVERVGTINFPNVARHTSFSGTPVVEVEIAANGRLGSAAIRRSSGNSEIDQAAIAILKLASPFDPFPSSISRSHDQIRFAYEWQFLEGFTQGSGVILQP